MTRLHEALERAQTLEKDPANRTAMPPASDGEHPVPDLPLKWQVEAEEAAPETVAESVGVDEEPEENVPEFEYHLAGDGTDGKLVVGSAMEVTLVEQYRRLAATLHHSQLRTGNHTVMIASAVEAEGKTLTATNLALTLCHSYRRRVLLVDADLRRPTIHQLFQLDNRIGLRDVLKQSAPEGKLPVQQVSPTLWVLTAGRPDPDPMSGLVSETMKQFLIEAAEQFDYVVLDTPPVALLPDANLLAAMVDSALLVVSAGSTPYPLVLRAIEAIGASRILGVVLNRADRSEVDLGYSYYNYYSSRPSPRVKPPRRFRFALHRKG